MKQKLFFPIWGNFESGIKKKTNKFMGIKNEYYFNYEILCELHTQNNRVIK